MNTAKICAIGLLLGLCGCTDSLYEMKQVPPQLSQAEIGEIVGSRLSQQGFTIVDIRTRQDSIFIQEQSGEFVLSRDVKALSKANNAACVVAGTFGRLGKSTVVSVRMIRASDNVILSSADGVLVRGRQ